jgi:hypothetical protein
MQQPLGALLFLSGASDQLCAALVIQLQCKALPPSASVTTGRRAYVVIRTPAYY